MMRLFLAGLAALLLLWSGSACTSTTPSATVDRKCEGQDPTLAILPCIVKVTARTARGTVEGSGFIVDAKKGYILTATHVLANYYRDSIKVTFRNGVSQGATWVAQKTTADISLLRTAPTSFPPLSCIPSYEPVPGQDVFAVGWVADSYKSSNGKITTVAQDKAGYKNIVTDVQAEQGMSGGPLVNRCGEVIGILSLGSGRSAEALAIALSQADVDALTAFAEALPTPTPIVAGVAGFYGTVTVDGKNVADGTVVSAWIDGVKKGEAKTTTYYGESMYHLDVAGESALESKDIVFKIGDAMAAEKWKYDPGVNRTLNLTAVLH